VRRFIPLLTPEDEEEMINEELPDSPHLPLRNMVPFPCVIPITAGRDKSIKLINDANAAGKIIGVVAQKMSQMKIPQDDIHTIGTVARIFAF
jgi:ATP-dependent Lon protease